MDDDSLKISAKLSVHQFMLEQLFSSALLQDPAARTKVPEAIRNLGKAETNANQPPSELQTAISEEFNLFLDNVERRVAQTIKARSSK